MIKRIISKGSSSFIWKGFILNFPVLKKSEGFTLLELIVVFSIIAILSTIGVASYTSYARQQLLQGAVNDLSAVLNTAKSKASAQVKPSTCLGSLQGYGVTIYKTAVGSHVANSYTLSASCSGNVSPIESPSVNLPTGVTFDSSTDTSSIFFSVLTGAVNLTGPAGNIGSIVLAEAGLTAKKTITVDEAGVIE